MEEALEEFAVNNREYKVAKYRGDVNRDFSSENFNVESFPTILAINKGEITKYESEDRSEEDIKKFAEANL
jgi:hypothetical protein